ncbi:MAG: hypothetical protein ACK5MY_15380, partial [Jhaorihella sp.]
MLDLAAQAVIVRAVIQHRIVPQKFIDHSCEFSLDQLRAFDIFAESQGTVHRVRIGRNIGLQIGLGQRL